MYLDNQTKEAFVIMQYMRSQSAQGGSSTLNRLFFASLMFTGLSTISVISLY